MTVKLKHVVQVLAAEPEWSVAYEEILQYLKEAYVKMVATLK